MVSFYLLNTMVSGKNQWKDHAGNGFNRPMSNSNLIKVSEPGDLVEGTDVNSISMVGGFDWTVTDNEDVHLIARVKDNQNNKTVHVHTYKPAGATNFITTTNFGGAEALYSSGGNVYIIGLSGGRPFVEEAKGGTNAFTRVYEATSGKRFRKGQVYISNGKLYYYLLENNPNDNDDTQPTYLQIIDLKIGKQPFSVSLTSPNDGDTFETEDVISVNAIATTDVGEISKVEFLIDGNSFQEDTTQPYAVNWTATSIGEHTVQAIAYDTNGETLSSTINTIAVTAIDKTDLTGDVYTLRNMQTGLYLTSNGSLVTANDVREGDDRKWTFVKTTSDSVTYYNIDSETDRGILRATGGGNGTPFAIVNTGKGAPATDVDKIWTVHYNEADDTYRFEARNQNRFLYHHEDGDFYNLEADSTDPRSKWQVVSSNVTLSIADVDKSIETPAIKIYPNPTSNNFTVKMLGNNAVESIEIYNILGRKVYANTPKNNMLQVDNAGFVSGVYLVKAISKNNKSFHARLVVK